MNREETLLELANLYDKANKIERSINWHNDADRDLALTKLGHLIIEANWKFAQVYNQKGV